MKLLIKAGRDIVVAAHIPDSEGKQLCKTRIKLSDWEVRDSIPENTIVCWHCRHIYAQRTKDHHSNEVPYVMM